MNLLQKLTGGASASVSRSPDESTPARATNPDLAAAIANIQNLQTNLQQHASGCAQFDATIARLTSAAHFGLSPETVQDFVVANAGRELARTMDPVIRATVQKTVQDAANEGSRAGSRIRELHTAIDEAIRQLVIASLPEELRDVEVTREGDAAARGQSVHEAFGAAKVVRSIHVSQSRAGKLELSQRLDPAGVISVGAIDYRGATIERLAASLASLTGGLEKLAVEEYRAEQALAKLKAA